jgi:hypothetical protein
MKDQTTGTWLVIAANSVIALVGVLQGVDWLHLVGPTAGWIAAVLSAANAFAHYYSGPIVTPTPPAAAIRRTP